MGVGALLAEGLKAAAVCAGLGFLAAAGTVGAWFALRWIFTKGDVS